MWSILIEKKIIHNHYNDINEINNFGTPFLGHHYYILSLTDLCLGAGLKFFKRKNTVSVYDLYDHAQEPLSQGHEIYNLGRPFFGHHYFILGLSDLCLGVEKKIVKKIMHFYDHVLAQELLPRG